MAMVKKKRFEVIAIDCGPISNNRVRHLSTVQLL